MASRILEKLREKVRTRDYVMTVHAEEEMDEDDLSIFDVESAVLTGKIVGRQRDRRTGERKYVVRGRSVGGGEVVVTIVKLGPTGKLVFLTVYVD